MDNQANHFIEGCFGESERGKINDVSSGAS